MRKNRTKHEAKKPRLAKRALALCFALIFVCSCLLPAFANSEVGALAGTQETVVEQQPTNDPTEGGEDLALLNEGGTDSAVDNTDSTGNDTNPTGSGTNPTEEPKPAEQEPKADEPKTEETKNEGTTESKDSTEEQPKNEGTTGETKPEETKPEGTTEEPKTEETKPEEPKQPTTNTAGDTIEQGEATYTYRFWPDKIDAFDLEAINADVKSGTSLNDAAQSRAGMVPCTVLTVMTNANLRDYQANVQQPTKPGYEFAGWYTVDGTTEDKFSFEQSLNFEKSKTIDVFAKWVSVAEKNAEKYRGWYENLVNTSDEYTLGVLAAEYFADKDFYSYLGSLPENEQAELWEKLEPVNMPEVDEAELEDEAVSLEDEGDEGIALLSITAPARKITVGKKLILTSDKKAHQGWSVYWQADHSWTTSNSNVAKVESGKLYQTEKAVVTGMSAGTATITHTVKWWYYDRGNRVDYSTARDTYDVRVVTETLGGNDSAAVFLLKTPTSDPKSNATSEWAPNDGAIRWIGEVNVYGALWENNKNINSYAAQHVTKWPDGTTGSVWTLTKTDKTLFGNSGKTYFEDVRDMIFEQYKASIEKEIRDNNPTLSGSIDLKKEDITQIKVTPFKISKDNGTQQPNKHIDCTIDVVNDKVYTAKFWVLEPGATSYTQVDAASYLKEQQVAKTSKAAVGSTKAYDGIDYVLKGWYKEDTQHKGAPDDLDAATGTLILNSEWSYRPSNDELKDGTVNFYAEYVPDNSATEDQPYIIVEKEVKGLTDVNLLRSDFCITINGTEYPVSSKYGEIVHTAGGFKIRWKISADAGSYTVDEENYKVSGYNVVNDGTGTVTTKTPDINFSAPVMHPSCSNQDFTVESTEQKEIIFVIALHPGQQDTNLVISRNPLSVGVREAIKVKLNSMGSSDWNNSKTEFYSIATNGEKFVVANTIVTYNETTGKIHIGEKCNWTKTATLEWSKSGGINPEVSITNTYTPATTSLTVTKAATKDGVEDTTTEFNFTLTLGSKSENVTWSKRSATGTTGGSVTGTSHEFTLKGGESITFSGISVEDTNVKVEEASVQHYTTTIKVNGEAASDATISAETLKQHQEAGTKVEFTNAYTTPKLESMTIQKVVTGAFGERTKEFNFSVKLENTTNPTLLNGVTVSGAVTNKDNLGHFTMNHGGSVTLGEIPIGTTITITETGAKDYDTKATNYEVDSNKKFIYEVVADENGNAVLKSTDNQTVANSAITVENNFDGTPDTGVLLDTLPYLILLAVAVAGGVLVVVRKRKHRDE